MIEALRSSVLEPANRSTPAQTGAPIRIENLEKRFGDLTVLNGLNLEIEPGQFIAVVGRSGCGKSTLLRILAGLDAPSAGVARVDGRTEPSGVASVARMMFQEPRLLPWQRVLANVEVGLGSARRDHKDHGRALETLRSVGLGDRSGEWPSVLSGGQKQRVALARALVSRPRFLALDEPLGALDALTRIEMQQLLEQVWREQGFTAVLVTHDVSEAVALADRVVLIDAGRITLDVEIDLPRPRRRGSPELAALEGRILRELIPEPELVGA